MKYKKTLTGILTGASIGLSSLFYSGNAEAAPNKTYVAEPSYKDTIKEMEGDEVIITTSIEGNKYSFTFEHNLRTIIIAHSPKFFALSRNNDTGNLKISFGNLAKGFYVLEVMPAAKDKLPETRVTRLRNIEVAGDKTTGYTFMGVDNIEYFVNMKTGGIVKYNRLPTEETLEIEEKDAHYNGIVASLGGNKTQKNNPKDEEKPKILKKPELFEKTTENNNSNAGSVSKPNKIIPINMIGKEGNKKHTVKKENSDVRDSNSLRVSANYLNIDAGYNPNAEPINPFTVGEKEDYSTLQTASADKNAPVLDEEAGGCGVTDLFRNLFGYSKDTGVAEKAVHDASVEDKIAYDAGFTDSGTDTGSALDSGVEPALEPIAKRCTINGLARYFVSNNHFILTHMYKGHSSNAKIKGDFAFSGSIQNGRVVDLLINPAKTTLDETKKTRLEKILLEMRSIPIPRKDAKCGFDEIILRF